MVLAQAAFVTHAQLAQGGVAAASKKLSDRRSLSRPSLRVSMLAVLMATTADPEGSRAGSAVMTLRFGRPGSCRARPAQGCPGPLRSIGWLPASSKSG